MRFFSAALALAATAVLVLAACGDDDDDVPATATPGDPGATATTGPGHPSDVAGSVDFAGVDRFPGSWVLEFAIPGRGVHHCGGLKNDFIADHTLQRYGVDGGVEAQAILQHFETALTGSGWAVATEGAKSISFERDLVDCGDGVVIAREGVLITVEDAGYVVERAHLQGTDPYPAR